MPAFWIKIMLTFYNEISQQVWMQIVLILDTYGKQWFVKDGKKSTNNQNCKKYANRIIEGLKCLTYSDS